MSVHVSICSYPEAGPDCSFVCFVSALTRSSKRAARIPGHLREQREADCRAEEDVGSERRLFKKRVGEEGMRIS